MTPHRAPGAALAAWLERLDALDPARIEPGLERVAAIVTAMGLAPAPFRVFTVGGTNGKGSVAGYLSAILSASGRGPVGTYTSPHLLDYRERIVVDGRPVSAVALVAALDAVEAVRGDIPLSYFEFGTAAAFEVFRHAGVREAVLEVGLGGRLDAVNVYAAAAAAVVSVGLDHQRWLGNDRDSIGREKAGIFRAGRPAIIGERAPPAGLLAAAHAAGAEVWQIGRDFDAQAHGRRWHYRGRTLRRGPLAEPGIAGPRQRDNAATALALYEAALGADGAMPAASTLGAALAAVRLPGRIQRIAAGAREWVLDVAHNPDAAAALATFLRVAPARRTLAVFGILADKDAGAVATALAPCIDAWFLGGLGGRRGLAAGILAERVAATISRSVLCENIGEAVEAAVNASRPGDRIVVFGSFHTVAEALRTGRIPQEEACANG